MDEWMSSTDYKEYIRNNSVETIMKQCHTCGLYLEDLYVRPEWRGRGFGHAILRELARIARARGCGRMEWWCLDWNEPSIGFYRSLGAEAMDEWTVYRLSGDTLERLAE